MGIRTSSLGDGGEGADEGADKPTRSIALSAIRQMGVTGIVYTIVEESKIGDSVLTKGDKVRYWGPQFIGDRENPGGCVYWFDVEREGTEGFRTSFYNDFGSDEFLHVEA